MAVVTGGTKCNLITGYSENEDSHVNYGKHKWLAQTFTLAELNVVFRCRFKSWVFVGGKFYEYAIRATDGAGKPLTVDICHTTLSPTGETPHSPGKWRRFDFSTFPNLPAGTYALIARVPTAVTTFDYKLSCDATAPEYPLGKAWESNDSGSTWAEIPNTDFMFEVWGWEPPPISDPTPVISNWAPLNYQHTSLLDGFTIVITTDIPIHLFMRWTTTEPLKHPMAEYRRGILVPIGTRYCFVAWKENEQLEPGDTLIHTFEKRNWPVCQTRYFYFIGTKQTEEQPSASPILYKHRTPEYEPSMYGPVIALDHNRTIQYSWGTWPITHDSPTGSLLTTHGAPWYNIRCEAALTISYWIQRGFLRFDTSGIPTGSLILEAILSLWATDNTKTSSDPFPHIYVTQGVQSTPIVPTDYGDQLPHTTIGGQVHLDDIIVDQYNHINLNDDGLSFINTGGITKLCLRQEMDVVNIPPPLGTNRLWWTSAQGPEAQRPTLTVYYVPP